MAALPPREGDNLELGVTGMPKIIVKIYNGDGKTLRRKTIAIRGRLKIWLFAAHRTLQFISASKEVYGDHAKRAEVELEGIARDEAFQLYKNWVKAYSPIPVEIYLVEKKPA
ncbi:hypothetical protein [Pyrodictium delaneyi]|uniref:hypothetical protein n=1 Tax=Pyrodictium delaneyi TaxID=1273541 RepID=UPI0018D107F4|nr:hypothetical protein [Pyrodictium delaneyi]